MHRPLLVFALLAASTLAALPVANSQSAQPFLSDDEQDVEGKVAGTDVDPPDGYEEAIDLVAFDIQEAPQAFRFEVQVRSLEDTSDMVLNDAMIHVAFYHGDEAYRVMLGRFGVGSSDAFTGYLERFDPGLERYQRVTILQAEVDVTRNVIAADVPRDLLPDEGGASPTVGAVLDRFHVTGEAQGMFMFGLQGEEIGTYFRDAMPDDGPSDQVFTVRLGIQSSGDARLWSREPFRISNGEATTFVYDLEAINLGNESDVFIVDASGIPKGWAVDIPGSTMRIDGGESEHFPVVVRTPFAHQHGDITKFLLELKSQRDPDDVGRLEIGVRYPTIAQPAGHHDELYFHSMTGSSDALSLFEAALGESLQGSGELDQVVMNTLADDPRDEGINVQSEHCGDTRDPNDTQPFAPVYCWAIPLDPGLMMGLDMDLDREGSIEVEITTALPAPRARISGQLMHIPAGGGDITFVGPLGYREGTAIAHIVETDPVEMAAGSSESFEAIIQPLPDGDLIPYERGAGLVLYLEFRTDRVENFFLGPKVDVELVGGGSMRLPLMDYEDAVQEIYDSGDLVELEAVTDQERRVNPGETVVFRVKVTNQAGVTDRFRLDLVGSNQEWGTILSSRTIDLADKASAEIDISVAPPVEAVAGDRADLILEVASEHDINVRGLIRLVATVVTDEDLPDQGETAADLAAKASKDSPAFEAVALLALLGAVAVLVRRRR